VTVTGAANLSFLDATMHISIVIGLVRDGTQLAMPEQDVVHRTKKRETASDPAGTNSPGNRSLPTHQPPTVARWSQIRRRMRIKMRSTPVLYVRAELTAAVAIPCMPVWPRSTFFPRVSCSRVTSFIFPAIIDIV
jgi:hypothetical protein